MPFWTVQRPETHRNGQTRPETGRTDQEGPARGQDDPKITKIARKGPKGPNNHRNGQTVAPKRQEITETVGKRPKQLEKHRNGQETTKRTRRPHLTALLSFSSSENQLTRSVLQKCLVRVRLPKAGSGIDFGLDLIRRRACLGPQRPSHTATTQRDIRPTTLNGPSRSQRDIRTPV